VVVNASTERGSYNKELDFTTAVFLPATRMKKAVVGHYGESFF
jgi:hypothetical protein